MLMKFIDTLMKQILPDVCRSKKGRSKKRRSDISVFICLICVSIAICAAAKDNLNTSIYNQVLHYQLSSDSYRIKKLSIN